MRSDWHATDAPGPRPPRRRICRHHEPPISCLHVPIAFTPALALAAGSRVVGGSDLACSGLQVSPLEPDAGQEFAEGGAVGAMVGAAGGVLGCEDEAGPVVDGDRGLHEEAASWWALHAKQP